jgi:hypothetical protein
MFEVAAATFTLDAQLTTHMAADAYCRLVATDGLQTGGKDERAADLDE